MCKHFSIKKEEYKGEVYYLMQLDDFKVFFDEVMKYDTNKSVVKDELIKEVQKRYEKAKRIKKQRIRLKKEKEVIVDMYSLMLNRIEEEV